MERHSFGEIPPRKNKKGEEVKMSRRELLKDAVLLAAAAATGVGVLNLMEDKLEEPGDGMTPETRETAKQLHDRLKKEEMMDKIDKEKEGNIYFGYVNLDDFLKDHPLVKENPEELEKARRYFEKNNK